MAAILVPRGSVHSAPALGTPTLRAVEAYTELWADQDPPSTL